MMRHHGFIDRYEIDLDTTGADHGKDRPVCLVRFRNYSASLPTLRETGQLTHRDGDKVHVIPAYMIEMIETWAAQHGYTL